MHSRTLVHPGVGVPGWGGLRRPSIVDCRSGEWLLQPLTIVNDPFDEDRVLREHLATLGGDALRESWRACSTEPQPYRDAMLREMVTRPDLADLA